MSRNGLCKNAGIMSGSYGYFYLNYIRNDRKPIYCVNIAVCNGNYKVNQKITSSMLQLNLKYNKLFKPKKKKKTYKIHTNVSIYLKS